VYRSLTFDAPVFISHARIHSHYVIFISPYILKTENMLFWMFWYGLYKNNCFYLRTWILISVELYFLWALVANLKCDIVFWVTSVGRAMAQDVICQPVIVDARPSKIWMWKVTFSFGFLRVPTFSPVKFFLLLLHTYSFMYYQRYI
jgi:hypothetical protein